MSYSIPEKKKAEAQITSNPFAPEVIPVNPPELLPKEALDIAFKSIEARLKAKLTARAEKEKELARLKKAVDEQENAISNLHSELGKVTRQLLDDAKSGKKMTEKAYEQSNLVKGQVEVAQALKKTLEEEAKVAEASLQEVEGAIKADLGTALAPLFELGRVAFYSALGAAQRTADDYIAAIHAFAEANRLPQSLGIGQSLASTDWFRDASNRIEMFLAERNTRLEISREGR